MTEKKIRQYLKNTIIYAYGIAATNVIKTTEEEIITMIDLAADAFLLQAGILQNEIPQKSKLLFF